MNGNIYVKEIMTKKPVIISPTATILEAAQLMKEKRVRGLLIEENKKLEGIVTERDLVHKVLTTRKDINSRVSDIMVRKMIVAGEDETLVDVTQKMYRYNISRLPVVNEGQIRGIITKSDIIKIYPGILELAREQMKELSPGTVDEQSTQDICDVCENFSEDVVEKDGKWLCPECREMA